MYPKKWFLAVIWVAGFHPWFITYVNVLLLPKR